MLALVFFVVARDTLLMVTFLVITCMIGLDRLVPYQGSMRLVGAYFSYRSPVSRFIIHPDLECHVTIRCSSSKL